MSDCEVTHFSYISFLYTSNLCKAMSFCSCEQCFTLRPQILAQPRVIVKSGRKGDLGTRSWAAVITTVIASINFIPKQVVYYLPATCVLLSCEVLVEVVIGICTGN